MVVVEVTDRCIPSRLPRKNITSYTAWTGGFCWINYKISH